MRAQISPIRILGMDDGPSFGFRMFRFGWPSKALALLTFVTGLLLLAGTVFALDSNKHLTQYSHTSWRIQDGSAPAGMDGIGQTSDGFLWFSSLPGEIYRFDGVRFVPWSVSGDHKSISTVNIAGDHTGGLWAVGRRDIVHLKGGSIASHLGLEGAQQLQTMSVDSDGTLWVVRSANSVSDAALCHVTEGTVKCFGKADGVPIAPIDSILPDGSGGFWLGGQTALVHWHSGAAETYAIPALKSNAGQNGVVSLALDQSGTLWIGILAEGPGLGLGRLVGSTVKPFVTPTFDGSKVVVSAMILDRHANLWVGTVGKGVFRIHGNDVDHYQHTEGLSSDTVVALFEDREGIIWVATTNGIDSFHDPRITTFSALEGLAKDSASGILAARDGSIWVANSESLDHIVDGRVSSIRTGSGLPGHQVTSLLEDRSGNLWVGVDDELYLFKNGQFRRLPEPRHQPLGLVVGITQDTDGNIWAECRGNPGKLVRIRDFQIQEEFPESQIPSGRTLAADPHGGIWIGTLKGDIALLRNGVLETKFPLNPGGDPFNRRIVAESDGSVLAGSENGLVGWRQGRVQRLTKNNGLPCDSVISFIEDAKKQWWLYTRCGVVEFADSELQRWWAKEDVVIQARLFDVLQGAQPNPPSFNSAAYSSDDRVWFANGLVVQTVDPSILSQKAIPAETYIESVTVDRREFAATENLKVPAHPRDLQIDYTSPTFLIPQDVKFRYRLDPADHDWHEAGTRRQAFYTDLRPGKYSFRVMACNSDGVWDETPAQLDFSVAPAYYQTNWFRALCAAAFVALLWAAYQLRVRRLHHQFDMTLEARVGERMRIARDLHDTLLQSAHGVLLRFQIVSQLLPGRPVEAKQKLDEAIEQTAEFITEARDEVQGLRDSTVQMNDLALAISTLGKELTTDITNYRPAFRVAVEGETRNLHPILRDEIYKIAAEALRNAFRHSRAKRVEAEIRYDNEQFRLRIRDDGRGIHPSVLESRATEGHYGLPGMRERAALVGGKLAVWSEVNAGTEVELQVPASAVYERTHKRAWLSRKAKV